VSWTYYGTPHGTLAQRLLRDGVVAASVSLVSAHATPTEVRIRWSIAHGTRADVERREHEGVWNVRAILAVDGRGQIAFTDTEVTPGEHYEYRLAFADGTYGGATAVEVPLTLTLALAGARPNPSHGALLVAFTLPDAASARLELFDLSGRRVAAREVGANGAGEHVMRLNDGMLAPGLYWAALTQGNRSLRTKIVVVE
jgi:hypothetical protein